MHNLFFKRYYFINKFQKNNIDKLDNNTAIIFRNYQSKIKIKEITKVKNYCKKKGLKIYLSNNVSLAIKLNLDGVYLPSFNKDFRHLSYSLKKNFLIIGSAHNLKEIRDKELQKTEYIFISSLFKRNKNYLGIQKFMNLSKLTRKKIIALGGISNDNKRKLKIVNCFGFAGISYFEQKKGPSE